MTKRLSVFICVISLLCLPSFAQGPLHQVLSARSAGGTPFITSQGLVTIRNNFDGAVGVKFTTGGALTVVALGRWKVAGDSGTHVVAIKIADGTVVASATVNIVPGSNSAYAYTDITPVTLSAATEYFLVSCETNGGDQWYDNDTAISTGSGATLQSASYQPGCTGSMQSIAAAGFSYGPSNFKYR